MNVNVVMLVKRRWRLTEQTVKTLRDNTPAEMFNLTVVEDVSDGKSECPYSMSAYGFYKHNETSIVLPKSKNITGQARNLGVYWAEKYWGRGDYLYLSDNDVYFTPEWLEKLIFLFSLSKHLNNIRLIGGWNHPFLQPQIRINRAGYKDGDVTQFTHDAVTGASQLMTWSTWDKYGLLDAHTPGVGKSEDWKFCQDIIKDGGRVGSVYPRVVLNCGLTDSFGKASQGADVMLKELIEAKKTYKDLYWE